jgi:nicotinate-nucleotide adenylyltransferase
MVRILSPVNRVLVGGTFDPPHLAHLLAGEVAFRQLGVDVVTFLPAGAPWQKAGRQVSSADHRWAMTQLAVAGVDYFEADEREVRRDGWTYTADTLAGFPDDDDLTLVLGADAAARIDTWVRADEVLRRARLAVAPRPGTEHRAVEEAVGQAVIWLDMPLVEISGSEIRARAAQGRPIRFLMREAVWEYVESNRLYLPGHIHAGSV